MSRTVSGKCPDRSYLHIGGKVFLLRLLEFTLIVLAFAFLVTQIIIPMIMDRPLFPILRKQKVDELRARMSGAKEDLSAAQLEHQIEGVEKKTERAKKR